MVVRADSVGRRFHAVTSTHRGCLHLCVDCRLRTRTGRLPARKSEQRDWRGPIFDAVAESKSCSDPYADTDSNTHAESHSNSKSDTHADTDSHFSTGAHSFFFCATSKCGSRGNSHSHVELVECTIRDNR